MSLSNENNKHIVVVPLGSQSADASVAAFHALSKMKLLSARVINGATIAASDTDFVQLSLMKYVDGSTGDVQVAEIDTRAAHENGLVALVSKALNIVSGQDELAAGSDYYVKYDETDSGTSVALTSAVLVLTMCQK